MKASVLILFCCLFACLYHAQSADSLDLLRKDSLAKAKANKKAIYGEARKATILSAVIPGAGQIYNKKYWKVPLIYGGIGGLAWYFSTNHRQFSYYRRNLRAMTDNDPATVNETPYNESQLQSQKNYYKKFRDFAVIGIGGIYLLNIIDANVDAHLKTFDVSDDLGLQLRPWTGYDPVAMTANAGLTLKLTFKK